ncbi:MAG: hypothetical protein ACOZQL_43105 [Myxococcota bacterium]
MSFAPLDEEALAAQVREVIREVPFYARYAEGSPLSSLPVLRRDDLLGVPPAQWVRRSIDLPAELAAGTIRPVTTSGSTDEPLKVYADLALSLPPAVWSMHGVADDAKLVNLTSPVCLGSACPGDVAPLGERVLLLTFGAGLFEASDAAITRAARAFNDFAPEIAFVNPVWLHWLHRRAQGLGLALHQPRLLVFTYQYPSGCQRRALARAFSAPQVEFYGASEFGGTELAVGCPEGHLHLVNYQAFAEQLASDVPGHAELVFTTPLSRTMPLLRYAPGDLGRIGWVDEGGCALWEIPTLTLEGRVADVLHAPDRPVTTREFDALVGEVDGLEFYEARSRGGALALRCVGAPELEGALREAVAPLGFSRVQVTFVPRLSLGASGKLRLTGEDDAHALDAR